jgi:hypothetical protein
MVVTRAASLALILAATAASAQPQDPYAPAPKAPAQPKQPAPAPPPTPAPSLWGNTPAPAPAPAPTPNAPNAPQDPYAPAAADLSEQIAESLVSRAQELVEQRLFVDAKQLAVEALVKSPKGPASEHAKLVIKQANAALGIVEPEPDAAPVQPPDLSPIEDPTKKAPVEHVDTGEPKSHVNAVASLHGAIYGAMLGAGLGGLISSDHPAAGAVPGGIAVGVVGALVAPMAARRWHADEAQVRTMGAGSIWGGVAGAMLAGTVAGANGGTVTGADVLGGLAVGSTLGALGGGAVAAQKKLTTGDVALVDTMAGIGTVGGLTLGMLMQPAQREAYSLNAALGAAAGVLTGYIAAPQTNTTPRRMLRVAGLSAAFGAAPFLLYAGIHDKHSTADERVTGGLATAGLVGGAWLGFYLTRHMDEGLDVLEGAPKQDDAPPAVVGRSSDGHISLGGLAIQPLSPVLAPQPGASVTVFGASF